MATWLPGVDRDESIFEPGGGSYVDGPPFRGVIHTTEGGWDSSMGVFRSKLTAPHVMAAPPSHPDGPRIVQFIPLDRSAYAAANLSGGVETNRANALQVEIVAFAKSSHEMSDEDLEWIGRVVVGPMTRHAPGPIKMDTVEFFGEDAGFTLAVTTARQRMSPDQWLAFNGWCGHQHLPENEHWDPGRIDIAKILAAAGEQEFTIMDAQTRDYFDKKFNKARERDRFMRQTQLNHGEQLRRIRVAQGADATELKEIDKELDQIKASLADDDDD